MPRIEVTIITKLLARQEKVEVLKSTISKMLTEGFNVRKVQSLGDRSLPLLMKAKHVSTRGVPPVSVGSYFVLDFDMPNKNHRDLKKWFELQHKQIIRAHMYKVPTEAAEPCQGLLIDDGNGLYEEKLEEITKSQKKKNFSHNLHSDIVPFPL